MTVLLKPVPKEEEGILFNLYSLYLHDLSKYTNNLDLGQDGAFIFDGFDLFWKEQGASPFFIMDGETIIGFLTLLERPYLKKEYDLAVNDIFILNKYRGKGHGIPAVKELFSQKKGKYFVIELAANKPAISFWKKVYSQLSIEFEEIKQEIDGDDCFIQTFAI